MRKYLIGVIMLLLLVCGCSNINNLSYNEIVSNSSSNNKTAGIGLIAVGLIGVVICLIPLFKKN